MWKKIHAILFKLFGPAIRVGDFSRVRKEGEKDADEERLKMLNRTWREMLREDPWMQKLMPHITLLLCTTALFFICYIILGLTIPAKHFAFSILAALIWTSFLYWAWIGNWYRKIQERVFVKFKERFGKHFHLK